MQIEHERRKLLIQQWRSASQSTQSSQPSPPTPARRRPNRPIPQPPERQHSPSTARRCFRAQHIADGLSPPPRRAHSAQPYLPHESRQINGERDWHDSSMSPIKRPQSAGAVWKNNPKVTHFQKPKKSLDANENQRTSSQRDLEQMTESNSDDSQITYNPTFQTHSPAHSVKVTTGSQPYIAQIITYPMSQQVTPPSPPKYIAPPEEYQDPQTNPSDNKFPNVPRNVTAGQIANQPPIYYIHGTANTNSNPAPDLVQQRQQTAIHLQQYVAMKQAQQQMYTYFQRSPHTVYPNVDHPQRVADPNRVYEQNEEGFIPPYGEHPVMRPHSAPGPAGVMRPVAMAPGFKPSGDGSQMIQMSVWSHMTPVVSSMGPWMSTQMAQHEVQYYHQGPYVQNVYRPNSAGSAGTLTRYHKEKQTPIDFSSANSISKNNLCQSINLVRQKPVGQIVSLGGQELTVCQNANDSSSPASVSTDSGVSPGNNGTGSKNSVFSASPGSNVPKETTSLNNTVETKNKKNKSIPFNVRTLKNSKSLDST